jgi:hypothetical protein
MQHAAAILKAALVIALTSAVEDSMDGVSDWAALIFCKDSGESRARNAVIGRWRGFLCADVSANFMFAFPPARLFIIQQHDRLA